METHASQSNLLMSLGGNNSRIARMGQWLKESF
jgi:cell division protein FtsA